MSIFLKHEPCPKCGPVLDRSGDNLGVFSDGHKWCFACGYYQHSSGVIDLKQIKERIRAMRTAEMQTPPTLPGDHTYILPPRVESWLAMYGISADESSKYRMGWSENYERLILPYYDSSGNLLMWQGRYFPANGDTTSKRPKYFTQGRADSILALFGNSDADEQAVCVVEDFVSAIKVARVHSAICLWGSELSLNKLKRIAIKFTKLFIWLDKDKASHSAKCEVKARPYFTGVTGIYTTYDPKCYTTEEIRKWLSPNQ